MDADLYDEFVSHQSKARRASHLARCACADLAACSGSQGNYIGPDDDLDSDYSGDEAQQQPQSNGADAGGAEPPLRAYDEDDEQEQPLEGMEVDGALKLTNEDPGAVHALAGVLFSPPQ